jgi:predicted O-methyltransferase YrrM
MQRLSPDKYLEYVIGYYKAGLDRFGDQWVHADINTVLIGISKLLQPEVYLEIGVRRGRSMSMVISQVPKCTVIGFDLWIENYAGMDNPGEAFVRQELKRLGYNGTATFVPGDSKVTVPRYFKGNSDSAVDLITVDGDHSERGARLDLENVIPHLKIGGVLVFDDTCNQSHKGLNDLWADLVCKDARFAAYTFNETGFGVGFAVRKS